MQSLSLQRIILTSVTTLLLFCTIPAFAAPQRVAILPFEVHAEKDLGFLQEGILDMLASRLAWKDKVEVINKTETRKAYDSVTGFEGESRALLVGGKLDANYVLFGSLTVFGESVSIDAMMVDVSGQHQPLPFFAQTRSMGEVIPQINQFATNINTTVFGRTAARAPVTAQAPGAGVGMPTPQTQPPGAQQQNSRMHPEKLLLGGVQGEGQVPVAGQQNGYQPPNPAFVAIARTDVSAGRRDYWRSRNFKTLINGVEIADVDNDGRLEVVMATEKIVAIYRMENGHLRKVAETAETDSSSYIGVDVADVNGNGTPEIYVSSLGPNRTSVDSFVLEYNGKEFVRIFGPDNWLYRVSRTDDRGPVIMGQRIRAAEESIFNTPIMEMQWEGDRLVPGKQLLPARKANVLGVAYGDVTQDGQNVLIGYSPSDRLRLFNPSGEYSWEDSDRTGGNMIFFKPPKNDPGMENKQFFPLRVRLVDIDHNGETEVLVARHEELTRNLAKNFRSFSKARLESKVWNGLTLVDQWKTQELPGRVSDFVVGDYDNDGADELLVAVVAKEGAIIFSDAVSHLIAFELNTKSK